MSLAPRCLEIRLRTIRLHRAHRELSKAEVANVRLYEFTHWIKPTELCLSGYSEAEGCALLLPVDRKWPLEI